MTALKHLFATQGFIVLGGHDHEESYTQHGKGWVFKAGADAEKACVIELMWPNKQADMELSYRVETVKKYQADPRLLERVNKHMTMVRSLDCVPLMGKPNGKYMVDIDTGCFKTTIVIMIVIEIIMVIDIV